MRIAVLGMGNVLMGDDGLGPYVIQVLKAQYDFDPDVELLDVGTPGLDLTPYMTDVDSLIIVDTVRSDAPAGSLRCYEKATLLHAPRQTRFSPHDPGLGDCLTLLEIAGRAPSEVLLVGVVPAECVYRAGLSAAVQCAVRDTVAEVVRQLALRGVTVSRRIHPVEPDIWWEHVPGDTR